MKNIHTKNTHANCKGCFMQDRHTSSFIRTLTDSDICPCSTCLVKVLCEETCEAYEAFCDSISARGRK